MKKRELKKSVSLLFFNGNATKKHFQLNLCSQHQQLNSQKGLYKS